MAAGGAVANLAASVTPASVNSGAANNTPTQPAPVFSANASPSVNEELEAKFAEMEQPSPGKVAPGTPTEQGASAQGSSVQSTANKRMTTPVQNSGNWDEEESERQDAEAAARTLSEEPDVERASTAGDTTPGQGRGNVQSTNDDLEAKFAEMEARSKQNTSPPSQTPMVEEKPELIQYGPA